MTLLDFLNFSRSPAKTEFGDGMVQTDIALSKDETLTMYCHRDALPLVEAGLRRALECRDIAPTDLEWKPQ